MKLSELREELDGSEEGAEIEVETRGEMVTNRSLENAAGDVGSGHYFSHYLAIAFRPYTTREIARG